MGSNAGIVGMTKEHLGLALALNVPVFVVVTKIDMCPANILQGQSRGVRTLDKYISLSQLKTQRNYRRSSGKHALICLYLFLEGLRFCCNLSFDMQSDSICYLRRAFLLLRSCVALPRDIEAAPEVTEVPRL